MRRMSWSCQGVLTIVLCFWSVTQIAASQQDQQNKKKAVGAQQAAVTSQQEKATVAASTASVPAAPGTPAAAPSAPAAPQQAAQEVAKKTAASPAPAAQPASTHVASTSDQQKKKKTDAAPASTAPVAAAKPAPAPSVPAVTQQAKQEAAKKTAASPAQAPQPAQPTKLAAKEKPLTIDSVDLKEPSGNWLFKRIWWEKAEEEYDKIKHMVEEVAQLRMSFLTKRTELARNLFDPFYVSIGMGQGELSVILNYLIEQMTELKQREGALTSQEREFLELLTIQKKTLEQLKADVDAVAKVDNQLDEAEIKLNEQTNLCHTYDQQAWQHFRTIAKELSDKRARELFYAMENLAKNIEDILAWIHTPFTSAVTQLEETARTQIERIKSAVQELKEKGIDFKNQAKQMEDSARKRDQERSETDKERAVEQAIEKTKEEFSWMARIAAVWDFIIAQLQKAWQWVEEVVGGWLLAREAAPATVEPMTGSGREHSIPEQPGQHEQQPMLPSAPAGADSVPAPTTAPASPSQAAQPAELHL